MEDDDTTLNPKAVNAPFPTRDQVKALIARESAVLDLLEEDGDKSWINNPNNELRAALRAITSEERKVQKQLNVASAVLQRDFEIGTD